MNRITGIMTAAAAAALLSISPVAAQEAPASGTAAGAAGAAGTPSGAESELGLLENERFEVRESFERMDLTPTTVTFDYTVGATVPQAVTLDPVPEEMFAAVPAIEGHSYVALPDGNYALVDPDTRVILDIF